MELISPSGSVYQAGTLSGNPIAMACGLATIDLITKEDFLNPVIENTKAFAKDLAKQLKITISVSQQIKQAPCGDISFPLKQK